MKKIHKLLLCVLFVIITASSLAACSKKDIPNDYQLIARDGDTFRLYVPTQGWMPNTSSGITSAFFAVSNAETGKAAVSVSVYIPDDAKECETIEEYWEICNAKLEAELAGYTLIKDECSTVALGGEVAKEYVYTAKKATGIESSGEAGLVTYKFMQITAMHDGQIYVLMYSAPEAEYEKHLEAMNGNPDPKEEDLGIIGYFKFAEPYAGDDKKKFDKTDAPDGMTLASSKERPYKLFMPSNGWTIDTSAKITSIAATDKSNLTVQYFMPDKEINSVDAYWEQCMEKNKDILVDLEIESTESTRVGGIESGLVGVFRGKSGGVEYKFKQAIAFRGEIIYVVTYTAITENFDSHIEDVDKMLEHFTVR